MPFMSDIDIPEENILRCEDCGRPYSDPDWIDCTLPDEQWRLIHPNGEGGILCGACMIKRIEKLPAARSVCAIRMCADFGDGHVALVEV